MKRKEAPDFKRVKRKLGKKVPSRETKLSFKTKCKLIFRLIDSFIDIVSLAIILPDQGRNVDKKENATFRNQSVDDLIVQTRHHNDTTRKGF